MTVSVAVTGSRMGRPPLSQKSLTQPTMVRLTTDVRERIVKLVGDKGMADFIRSAVEAELMRREPQSAHDEIPKATVNSQD